MARHIWGGGGGKYKMKIIYIVVMYVLYESIGKYFFKKRMKHFPKI